MVEVVEENLTKGESELYDRQIRLWGLESQKRLRNSKILIAGLNGLGAEIAKNIILAGVKSVTFLDHRNVTQLDFTANFFVPRDQLGLNRAESSIMRAQALNPLVELKADTGNLTDKNEEYFKQFHVVVILESEVAEQIRINNFCRSNNIKFYAADMWGMFGYSFIDLQRHEFSEDVIKHKTISKPNEKVKTEMIAIATKFSRDYPSLESVVEFDYQSPAFIKRIKKTGPAYLVMKILQKFREDEKRDPSPATRAGDIAKLHAIRSEISSIETIPDSYFEHVFAQISPAAAIVGGAVGQEIIKAVSQKEAPHFNYFFFDAEKATGFIETIE